MRTLSPARKKFRRFLNVLLLLSFVFFVSVAGLFATIKLRIVKMKDVAPALIQVDVIQHQAKSYLVNRDEQLKITRKMIRQGFLSPQYAEAGSVMLDGLVHVNHAPSITFKADLIRKFYHKNLDQALGLYQRAASHGHVDGQIMASLLNTHSK